MILGHALALAINRYDHLYKAMRPPLSLTQLIILQSIEDGTTMYESGIAEKTGLEAESVRLVLHRILKRKFFERRGRGKVKKLHVTPAGREAIQRSSVLAARTEMMMLERLPRKIRDDFSFLVTTLSAFPSQTP